MRMTVDLDDDVVAVVEQLRHDEDIDASEAINRIARCGLTLPEPAETAISPITGLPVIHLGGPPFTKAYVEALEDEEDEYLMSFIRPRVSEQ